MFANLGERVTEISESSNEQDVVEVRRTSLVQEACNMRPRSGTTRRRNRLPFARSVEWAGRNGTVDEIHVDFSKAVATLPRRR